MPRVTAPFVAFFHPSPMSRRTLCQDEPSGARVPILMTIGPAWAKGRAGDRSQRTAAAAASLFQEQLIHPPFQPSRLALRDEVGQPVFGRVAESVEGERPVEKPEELPPVLRA